MNTMNANTGARRATLKPLAHWAIYRQVRLRYGQRQPDSVWGTLITPDGQEVAFRYVPQAMTIYLPAETITINEYGWELARGPAGEAPQR